MKICVILIVLLLPFVAFAQYQPHAIWSREGAGDSSLYGSEILALGDQNDDGFNDWAVYAAGLGYAPAGSPNEPRVEFFHGGNPPDNVPYMVRVADRATEISVRGAKALGDLNGDGYIDWYIFTGYIGDTTGRHIYKIYFGGPGPHEEPNLILTSPILSGYSPIGDFNGDGFNDLFLSDGWNERAYIFFGGNPMDTIPDWQKADDLYPGHVGNVNGDGYSDIACYSNISGHTDIHLGSANPDTVPEYHWPTMTLDFLKDLNHDGFDDLCYRRTAGESIAWGGTILHYSEDAYINFACSGSSAEVVVSAGDFNADTYNDIAMIGYWCDDSWYGTLTLHLGGPWINPERAFVIYGWTDPLNLIGIRVACNLGDVNGDHIDDLAVGANNDVPNAGWRGKAVVLAGDTTLHMAVDNPRPELPNKLDVMVYPNPFNNNAIIRINLPVYAHEVYLHIYNLLGQEVFHASLVNASGDMTYLFDASLLSSGLYLLHVSSGNLQTTTKLMLLR